MKKKIISFILSLSVAAGFAAMTSVNAADLTAEEIHEVNYNDADTDASIIKVYINGKNLEFDVPPQIRDDRTLVPLRAIFEGLGATVEWDDATKTVKATRDTDWVKLTIGEMRIYSNKGMKTLDCPAVIEEGRTLVPVRAVSESFTCDVKWYQDKRLVSIAAVEMDMYTDEKIPPVDAVEYTAETYDEWTKREAQEISAKDPLRQTRAKVGDTFLGLDGYKYELEPSGIFMEDGKTEITGVSLPIATDLGRTYVYDGKTYTVENGFVAPDDTLGHISSKATVQGDKYVVIDTGEGHWLSEWKLIVDKTKPTERGPEMQMDPNGGGIISNVFSDDHHWKWDSLYNKWNCAVPLS